MSYFVKFFVIFFVIGANAQADKLSISIGYVTTTQMETSNYKYQTNSFLHFNEYYSLYTIDHLNSLGGQEESKVSESKIAFGIKAKENDYVFKNLIKNEMFYSGRIGMQQFDIADSLQLMEWTLGDKRKEILGYACQEATAIYGGRFYIAYFTTEIAIPNGPWRFHGLPGLILEVYSLDNVFKIEATSIEIEKTPLDIKNPFENEKLISWGDFLSLYRKKYDEVIRNSMTEWGPTQTLPKKGIVEYIKD